MRHKHHVLHTLLMIISILLALILTAAAITGTLIMRAGSGSSGEFRYLILLGTAVNGTEPSSMLQDRINAAYTYLTENPDVICIVSGGMGDDENITEATCMYNGLTQMGISSERIWLEDKATSTRENLQYSLALIEEKTGSRPETIGILSSEFHLLRANMFAKEQNVTAVTLPAKTTDPGTFWGYFLREILMVWYYSTIG